MVLRTIGNVALIMVSLFILYVVLANFIGLSMVLYNDLSHGFDSPGNVNAHIYVNQTGSFLRVKLKFDKDKPMYVERLYLTCSYWIVNSNVVHKVGVPYVGMQYTPSAEDFGVSRIEEVLSDAPHINFNRMMKPGTYTFNITNLTSDYTGVLYNIWDGNIVINDKTIPLKKFGKVRRLTEEKVIYNMSWVTSIHARVPGKDVFWVRPDNKDWLRWERTISNLYVTRGMNSVVEYVKKTIFHDLYVGLKTGRYSLYSNEVRVNRDLVMDLLSNQTLYFTVKVELTKTVVNGTLTRGDTGFVYYIAKIYNGKLVVYNDTKSGKLNVKKDEKMDVVLYTPRPIPDCKKYGIVVIYRHNPYAYEKAIGYFADVNVYYPVHHEGMIDHIKSKIKDFIVWLFDLDG